MNLSLSKQQRVRAQSRQMGISFGQQVRSLVAQSPRKLSSQESVAPWQSDETTACIYETLTGCQALLQDLCIKSLI